MKNVHIATYQDAAAKLANTLPAFDEPVVVRLGGTKRYEDYPIQINSIAAVNNSINKLQQKKLLLGGNIATLPILDAPVYPAVIKGIVRSCGTKVFIVNNNAEFKKAQATLKDEYYIEPLFNATSEYRLHCTRDKVFFTVKKFKRNPQDIIINHDNHYNKRDFLKPRLWNKIREECLKAMKILDLDIACFDVLYCSADNNAHKFVIAEANTNPELLANTFNAYNEMLTELIRERIAARTANLKLEKLYKPPVKLTGEQTLLAIQVLLNHEAFITPDGSVTIKIKL